MHTTVWNQNQFQLALIKHTWDPLITLMMCLQIFCVYTGCTLNCEKSSMEEVRSLLDLLIVRFMILINFQEMMTEALEGKRSGEATGTILLYERCEKMCTAVHMGGHRSTLSTILAVSGWASTHGCCGGIFVVFAEAVSAVDHWKCRHFEIEN